MSAEQESSYISQKPALRCSHTTTAIGLPGEGSCQHLQAPARCNGRNHTVPCEASMHMATTCSVRSSTCSAASCRLADNSVDAPTALLPGQHRHYKACCLPLQLNHTAASISPPPCWLGLHNQACCLPLQHQPTTDSQPTTMLAGPAAAAVGGCSSSWNSGTSLPPTYLQQQQQQQVMSVFW
jgi:hypothetical protein